MLSVACHTQGTNAVLLFHTALAAFSMAAAPSAMMKSGASSSLITSIHASFVSVGRARTRTSLLDRPTRLPSASFSHFIREMTRAFHTTGDWE